MGMDPSGVLTVGTLVPKEGGHPLLHNTLLVIPPWTRKPPLYVGPPEVIRSGQFPCNTRSTGHTLAGWLQT